MKTQAIPPLFILALGLSNAYALPDPSKDTTLLEKTVSMKDIGPIMRDSDNDKLIYVKPSDLRVIGEFYKTSSGIDCENLSKVRSSIFTMPDAKDTQKLIDQRAYVSPTFQSLVAVPATITSIKAKIRDLRLETEQHKKDNADIYAEYSAAYQAKEIAKAEHTQAEAKYNSVRDLMMKELTTATTDAERAIVRASYNEDLKESMANLKAAANNRDAANNRYIAALRNWGPYKNALDDIKKLETELLTNLDNETAKAKQKLTDDMDLLNTLQKKVIGKATAGYSISTNERISLLQERIKEAGLDYSVRALDVFNVKLNPSVVKIDAEVKDQFNDTYRLVGYEIDSKTQVALGTKKRMMKLPATVEQEGEPAKEIEFEVTEFENSVGAAQSFEMAVTIGGYCGEPVTVEKQYIVKNDDGEITKSTVKYPMFTPQGDKVLYAQNVPLTYNYYEQAQPIHGHCRLDISQTSNYVRDHGKKKSGGFLRRTKTKSWDNTKHDYDKDMGMACELTKKPVGSNPEESELMNSAVEKALYQDMYSMFLASYAKDFTVIPLSPTELGEDSKFFGKIGTGMMNLCGKNKYCEFGSVVLKSMDDLVGSRHSGKSSSKQTVTGTIKKDFKMTSYLVSEGSANVQLKVCVDSKECK